MATGIELNPHQFANTLFLINQPAKMMAPESQIMIVGAGVFGLSTALWLARAGYKNITIFDRSPLDEGKYDPSKGCDGASADINKIFRTSYGIQEQ